MRFVDGRDEQEKDDKLEEPEYYEELSKNVKWHHKLLLNQPLKVAIVMILTAIVSPILIYYFVFKELAATSKDFSTGICSHPYDHRIQCGADNITQRECEVNCCYDMSNSYCYHLLPSRFSYIWNDKKSLRPRYANSPYRNIKTLPAMKLYLNKVTPSHLNFVLYNPSKAKYNETGWDLENMTFDHKVFDNEFFLEIYKKNTTDKIMTTARGPTIVSQNYTEWSFYLSDDYVYGMGELVLKSTKSKMWYSGKESASVMPFVMAYRNGSFHGLYVEQKNGMEFSVTESRVISVRSFSDTGISLHFFQGKNMKEVHEQFVNYVGKPSVPPYSAMGIHFCRSSYPLLNIAQLRTEFEEFLSKANDAKDGIVFDSDCISDDLFKYLNYDGAETAEIEEMVELLKGKSFLPSIRPHVLQANESMYNAALERNILMLDPVEDEPYKGSLYNKTVVYPDFSIGSTIDWLKNSLVFSSFGNSFVLKDSWPENNKNLTNCTVALPYIRNNMYDDLCKSIQWDARSPSNISHLENHNAYGLQFSEAVEAVAVGYDESLIISTSSFPGSRAGFISQNLESSWDSMKHSMLQAVANSMAGSYVQGVPVCGDANSTSEENFEKLCVKWYVTSIVLPIFHVHSNSVKRHPYAFSGFARRVIRNAFETRYRLLPYYYTVMNRGEPLLRGMYYEFSDEGSLELDEQFMVGDAVMIAPEFEADMSTVPVYFPNDTSWYDLWGGDEIHPSNNSWSEIPTLESDVPMFLRGGFILPIQEGDGTKKMATERRLEANYTLIIGLHCPENESYCYSKGFLDIGNFTAMEINANEVGFNITIPGWKTIQGDICTNAKVSSSIIDEIKVYGKAFNSAVSNYYSEKNLGIDICTNEVCTSTADDCIYNVLYSSY